MTVTTKCAVWIKQPTRDVGVVVVSSASLPQGFIQRLSAALDDWDEVAYLMVERGEQLQSDWLHAEGAAVSSGCEATQLLRAIPKGCFLLDIEDGQNARLTWLGSVYGHTLRFLELAQMTTDSPAALLTSEAERVVLMAQMLVKQLLEERFTSL